MNFDLDAALQVVQNFRGQLEDWGVTNQTLWAIGAFAGLLFLLSLREVATWFFKINKVRDEVRELRGQMLSLQRSLNETRDVVRSGGTVIPGLTPMKPEELLKIAAEMQSETAPSKKKDAGSPTKFRLDH